MNSRPLLFTCREVHPAATHPHRGPCWPVLLLAAWLGGLAAQAQDPVVLGQTNSPAQTEETSSTDGVQTAETTRDEDTAGTNAVAETNQMATPGPDARARRLERQRRARPGGGSQANGSRTAESSSTNAGPSVLDYAAFRVVAERNIFDPNRSPRSTSAPVRPKTVESFTLVGTMSYEKGVFAFFDGTSSDYRKAVKTHDSIAGYSVVAISPDSVKLLRNTNLLDLAVGVQMRRRDDGVWERSESATAYAATTTTTSSTPSSEPAASGAESDILKKMMQRRERE
jgi:hypothetical protein